MLCAALFGVVPGRYKRTNDLPSEVEFAVGPVVQRVAHLCHLCGYTRALACIDDGCGRGVQ